MARRRKAKQPRARISSKSDSDDSDEDSSSSEEEEPQRRKPPQRLKGKVGWDIRDEIVQKVRYWTDDEIEEKLAFCCSICKCSEERKAHIPAGDRYIQVTEDLYWHRKCCHGLFTEANEDWSSPAEEVFSMIDGVGEETGNEKIGGETLFTKQEVMRKYEEAKRRESEVHNQDELEGEDTSVLYSARLYLKCCLTVHFRPSSFGSNQQEVFAQHKTIFSIG